jgi:hypothetical protein
MFFRKNRRHLPQLCSLALWVVQTGDVWNEAQLRLLAMRIVGTSDPRPQSEEVMQVLVKAQNVLVTRGRDEALVQFISELEPSEKSPLLKRVAQILRVQERVTLQDKAKVHALGPGARCLGQRRRVRARGGGAVTAAGEVGRDGSGGAHLPA